MLIHILFIFVIWNGVIGMSDICNSTSNSVCTVPDKIRKLRIPSTERGLKRLCRATERSLDCFKNYADQCGYENVHPLFTEDTYQSAKGLVNDVCQKDSRLHLTLVSYSIAAIQNIECLADVQRYFEYDCTENLADKIRVLKRSIWNLQEEGTRPNVDNCVTLSLSLTCFTSFVTRKCGSDVRDAVMEIVARSNVLKHICSPAIEKRLLGPAIYQY